MLSSGRPAKVQLIWLSAKRLMEELFCSPDINCYKGKYVPGMLALPEGAASTSLKNKPVGGAKTGPTEHGLLGLAHKPSIKF